MLYCVIEPKLSSKLFVIKLRMFVFTCKEQWYLNVSLRVQHVILVLININILFNCYTLTLTAYRKLFQKSFNSTAVTTFTQIHRLTCVSMTTKRENHFDTQWEIENREWRRKHTYVSVFVSILKKDTNKNYALHITTH